MALRVAQARKQRAPGAAERLKEESNSETGPARSRVQSLCPSGGLAVLAEVPARVKSFTVEVSGLTLGSSQCV